MASDSTGKCKNKLITIPNILSLFRLCLIPVIVWLYTKKQDYFGSLIILMLSALTDIVDGFIARRFDMISDLGKALDPVADKLTQAATLYCLVSRFSYMIIPLVLLILKEITTGIMSLISIKKTGKVDGAVWHGKLTTVFLYVTIGLHIIWFNIPSVLSQVLVAVCVALMLASFVLYTVRNISAIRSSGRLAAREVL